MIKYQKITNRNVIILWMQIASMVHSVHSDQYLTITVDVKYFNFPLIYNLSEADYNIFYSDLCNETVITVKLPFKMNNLYSTEAEISKYSNLPDQSSPYVCQIVNSDFVCGRHPGHPENYTQYFFSSNAALCVKKCINFYADQEVQINASNNWLTNSQQECQISTSTSRSINRIDTKTSPSPFIKNVTTSASNTDYQHAGNDVEGNLPLVIGCSVGGAITIIVIFIVVFVVKKKHIRTNKKHSSPSTNTFNEFLKTEDASQTVSPSNLNYYDMRSGNTNITTESNDLNSSAIKNYNKSSDVLYSETNARNSNNNNGSHNKKFNPAHGSVYSTVDPVELNKSILRDQQVAANKAAQEPYVDVALPDQTASLYSRLRECGKDFQNVYNVSPTQQNK